MVTKEDVAFWGLILSIPLALLGYLFTYWNGLRTARRARQDAADDARAKAIQRLTTHLASAIQTIVLFVFAAKYRVELFTEQTIVSYDTDMRSHLTGMIQSLVGLAHHDARAFLALEKLVMKVWVLDEAIAKIAADYWTQPEETRVEIASFYGQATAFATGLSHEVVKTLQDIRRGARRPPPAEELPSN